jgi:hypothetical protein
LEELILQEVWNEKLRTRIKYHVRSFILKIYTGNLHYMIDRFYRIKYFAA